MYVMLFSGVGISFASASCLRYSLLALCVATLLCLVGKRLLRLASEQRRGSMAQSQIPADEAIRN
jgi:hypothetical protein